MSDIRITVVGAGVVGLWQALTLARAGYRVQLLEASAEPFIFSASRWAGAMLAPDCEAETAPRVVRDWGREAVDIWTRNYPAIEQRGTLVVASTRDAGELQRFSKATERYRSVDGGALSELEPDLSGRFSSALFFPDEAHMNARAALDFLLQSVRDAGADVNFGASWKDDGAGFVIDCRGFAARDDLKGLRGVRGERAVVRARDVSLSRPVRLLHPRQPIYVVPQGDGLFVVGATVIEREDDRPMTLKSALDLLGSAYALHSGFAEAEIIDIGAGVRPAFPDNAPRILVEGSGRIVRVNGAYRHGFLLAPILASAVAGYLATGERHAAFV